VDSEEAVPGFMSFVRGQVFGKEFGEGCPDEFAVL
jgi:hypothetical protein